MLRRILKDTAGASAIEYSVIAALISVAAIGAMFALGQRSNAQFETVEAAYENAS
ncbi:Flp/Fap pilin component [Tsuneonella dongtanensis]|uniref:Flp/Fap pilin component n=1 Tax=Tsuneonella dongtanensis TaxID=692370 RepID=A0A1B2AER0_9SPHN|nr:Flp family type IVb pilin [Tsuneonella dongtanensis]ANY20525.1 Flp/Fap pilin component [Tsuneonella dongtanensis]